VTLLNGVVSPSCKPKAGGAALGTLKSVALKALLVAHEGASLVKVEPQSGTTIMTITLGEECSIGESTKVEGSFTAKETNGQLGELKTTHVFEEGPLSALNVSPGARTATLAGSAKFSAAGAHLGKEWLGVASKPAWFVSI
jgi:hypothetical protein